MIPVLYSAEESQFKSNGLGRLTDCISCVVTEERNGIYEVEFVYPIDGSHYSDIKEGCIIYCTHDDSGDAQPFDIYKRSAEINGKVTFNAHHISYRLSNTICKPFKVESAAVGTALDALKANAINPTPFNFYTDKGATGTFQLTEPDSIKARLGGVRGSILDVYNGGEYEWDKFNVYLRTSRGVDNGVSIRYEKNITDLTAEKSIEGRYTGVVPFWRAADSDDIVLLPEYYILASALPREMAYWTNEEDLIMRDANANPFEFAYSLVALAPMDLSDEWTEAPTIEQLRDKATSRLNASNAWETDENIEVDFVALWQTPEYENVAALQRVGLCDTVTVYFPALDAEVSKKVIKVKYDTLLDRYNTIELGMPKTTYTDVITNRTVDLMSNYVRKGHMQTAIENATSLITGGLGGYVVFNFNANGQPEEILVMDTDDIDTAVKVIRINKNGIGFSMNGYQGPFTTAWTIDGHFVADFIDSGTLNADLIKAGTITGIKAGNSWNLNSGIFQSANSNGRSTRISGGQLAFYKNDVRTGYIAPFAWSNDYDNQEGVAFLASNNAVYLGIGAGGTTYILINNGLDPDGRTEKVQINGNTFFKYRTYFNQMVTANSRIVPDGDGAANFKIGDSTARWYQVWTKSLNFETGVYVNYNSSSDWIYASKTIQQASDENLKNIFEYDPKYDDLIDVLEPVIYTWKARPEGKRFVGLGARKTAAALKASGIEESGFVGINQDENGDEIYSVDYQELSVMLLHKVQNQQKEIDTLKSQMAYVMKRLEKLEGK